MSLRQVKGNSRLSRASGSTLIEVLVSALVLSFGMLGMAGVQGVSLRGNQAAYYRTMATIYSADIIERMRANISAVQGGGYDDVAGGATASCFTAAGCLDVQLAAQDILVIVSGSYRLAQQLANMTNRAQRVAYFMCDAGGKPA